MANLSQNLALAMESLFELESKMEGLEAKVSELAEAKFEAEQAMELADAQKMIFEQKLKIMELEQIEQKSAMDKLKSENQTLLRALSNSQELVEKLKSEKVVIALETSS